MALAVRTWSVLVRVTAICMHALLGHALEFWDTVLNARRPIILPDDIAPLVPKASERDLRALGQLEAKAQHKVGKLSGKLRRMKGGPSHVRDRLVYVGGRASTNMTIGFPSYHGLSAIALYTVHDSGIAVSVNRKVQCVLELERLFDRRHFTLFRRYFHSTKEEAEVALLRSLRIVRDRCECDTGKCPTTFDHGVIVLGSESGDSMHGLPALASKVFEVKHWTLANHHQAHAMMGFHSSPFRSALVVSYDGGGNDGAFNMYYGYGMDLDPIGTIDYNLGMGYAALAPFVPEVNGYRFPSAEQCALFRWREGYRWTQVPSWSRLEWVHWYGLPGKLMGYTALSQPTTRLRAAVRAVLEIANGAMNDIAFVPNDIMQAACGSLEEQRALAASIQAEFTNMVHGTILSVVKHLADNKNPLEGVVLTGGCALNVLTNQVVYDTLKNSSLDVYVPPSPNDGGLVVGGLWGVQPPFARQRLQYLGFRLWDLDTLGETAREWGARSLSKLGGVEYLAELLSGGPAWLRERNSSNDQPIVGVIRGRQEFGPRALGHRSLLAAPDSTAMKERMNRLKARDWYRPVGPIIANEALTVIFGESVTSPFMSLAPRVCDDIGKRFPGLAHFDGTARHQSVGKEDEPWIHALLLAVSKRIGIAALINTSFNTKGKPIVNTIGESLAMLDSLADLDYVLIEDWLFRKRDIHPELG